MISDEFRIARAIHQWTILSWPGPPRTSSVRADLPTQRLDRQATHLVDLWRLSSTRAFSVKNPSKEVLEKIIRVAYGDLGGRRNIPSAGALYGLTLYAILLKGGPVLRATRDGRLIDIGGLPVLEKDLLAAIFHQITGGPWLVILCGDPKPYIEKYGARGYRYLLLEAGHLDQELIRSAVSHDLLSCPIGAFDDEGFIKILGFEANRHLPLLILAMGFSGSKR